MKAFPDATHAWSVINTASMDIESKWGYWCEIRLFNGCGREYGDLVNMLIDGDTSRLYNHVCADYHEIDLEYSGIPMVAVITSDMEYVFIKFRTPFTDATVVPEPPHWFGRYWELVQLIVQMGEFRLVTVGPEGWADEPAWPDALPGTLIIWQSDETDHVDLARPE